MTRLDSPSGQGLVDCGLSRVPIDTIWSGSSKGNARINAALTIVNTVLFTPIPSARTRTAASVNQLSFARSRAANRRSWIVSSNQRVPRASSTLVRLKSDRQRMVQSLSITSPLRGFEHLADGRAELAPGGGFGFELGAAAPCQCVILRAAVAVRCARTF